MPKILFNHLDLELFKRALLKVRGCNAAQLTKEIGLLLPTRAHSGAEDQRKVHLAHRQSELKSSELELLAKNHIKRVDMHMPLGKLNE